MRILFLTTRFPYPADRGDKVRHFNFARVLSKEHELGLVCFEEEKPKEQEYLNAKKFFTFIRTVPKNKFHSFKALIKNFFTQSPWQVSLNYSDIMKKEIEQSIQQFKPDIIYVFHLRMAQYVEKSESYYRILDLTDSVSLFLERMINYSPWFLKPFYRREIIMVRDYESKLLNSFNEIWLISNVDLESIPGAKNHPNLLILPNGVDTYSFSRNSAPKIQFSVNPKIIFVGYMGIESINAINYFVKSIFPCVRSKIPSVELLLVGRNPPSSIKRLGKDPKIHVLGYISDLTSCYINSTVSVAPMPFVVGIQNKVLESMACGTPVVATSQANEGIDACNGKEILVSDDPGEFANHICEMIENENMRKIIAENATTFVREKYSWENILLHINSKTTPNYENFKKNKLK